jgi:tRNA(fMet)-specific endonuclease VapC
VTRYLLDTNVVWVLLHEPQGPLAAKIAKLGGTNVCTSIVVAADLRFGAAKDGSNQLTMQLEAILCALDTLPLDSSVDEHYARMRAATRVGRYPKRRQ